MHRFLNDFQNIRMNLRTTFLLIVSCICWVMNLPAQDHQAVDYDTPKEYEIGGVTVEGANFTDENAILSISGLRVGDRIVIPSEKFSKAVTKLWKLNLFTAISIVKAREEGQVVFITIRVTERPRLSKWNFVGIRKSSHESLNEVLKPFLIKGSSITTNTRQNAINTIKKYFVDKGFLDVEVTITEEDDNPKLNSKNLTFHIDRKEKVKIEDIVFAGNDAVKDKKLRRKMDKIHRKSKLFAKSRLVRKELEEDKIALIDYYNTIGYRDAKIITDSVWRDEEGKLFIKINLEEGKQYFYRHISWKGNTIHDEKTLRAYLGIEKGDVYNKELLDQRISYSPDGRDVSSLYLDDGYLFFRIDPIEVAVENDSIDIEMRIYEGPKATIDKVLVKGNTITHEHVIRRELFTRPGAKFSRSDIIRSNRTIIGLGFFDPEKIDIGTDVNQERGTVDITYTVEERPSDQLELSAGWGGYSGVIGTLGFQFNNFSLRNVKNRAAWHPLPKGDGQKLSIRAQTNSKFFQSYNFSFSEPWLGGRRPNNFTLGGYYTSFDQTLFDFGKLGIGRLFAGLGSIMRWPDDNFLFNLTLTGENIRLEDYSARSGGGFVYEGAAVSNGSFNNISLKATISRSTVYEPTYPKSGARISLAGQFTPPYSLFRRNTDYGELSVQERFKWLEYHKWRIDFEWYASLIEKLVFKASAKMGFLGMYNQAVGLSPFERYELGGDGLSNQTIGITGRDIIALRGYEVEDIGPNNGLGGGNIFNKFSLELRYPLSLQQNSTIYLLTFLDGGNSWIGGKNYNPFDLRRSAGGGLRVFLPMFGLLGFDYGFGFDKPGLIQNKSKWTEFGKFSIVLGFEPD